MLRLRTPAPVLGRGTTRDVEVDGTTIPAGAQVALLLDAGNLDPRHYDNPEVFDIRRHPVDNLGFGYGIHGCAGQALARLEAQAVIKALATHVESYTVARTERRLNNFTHPFSSIEITDVVLA
ncbi:cytochrome P450 [Corynebacterium suedekumii]|nr:cytochrome P450 [Corynebacterium suedekumii]